MRILFLVLSLSILFSCNQSQVKSSSDSNDGSMPVSKYFDYGDTAGVQTAGIRMIPITTPVGKFNVWTKRFGNNPKIKVLLLHGGPAAGHEYMEAFESFFPKEGFEFTDPWEQM